MKENKAERPLPANWPKDLPLPTVEEARKAVEEGEEMIADLSKQLKSKLRHTDPEFPKTQFII